MSTRLSCLFAILVVTTGCGRLEPAGFWTTYRPELIVRDSSDQGPWGGHRWVHWEAPAPGMFKSADVVRFATSQGWRCQKPVAYSAEQIRGWQVSGAPVFPLHFGSADRPPNDGSEDFFRHIDSNSWVIPCETGWIRVAPGSGDTSTALGYIQIDRKGIRLAVYHLWGET